MDLYHHAKFVGLDLACPWGQNVYVLCLFFLSILLLNGKVCECKIPIKPVEFKNVFDTVG